MISWSKINISMPYIYFILKISCWEIEHFKIHWRSCLFENIKLSTQKSTKHARMEEIKLKVHNVKEFKLVSMCMYMVFYYSVIVNHKETHAFIWFYTMCKNLIKQCKQIKWTQNILTYVILHDSPFFPMFSRFKTTIVEVDLIQQRKKEKKRKGTNNRHEEKQAWR